jgi:microsomal dipeptidase-like Zn-dependent dipeptidase
MRSLWYRSFPSIPHTNSSFIALQVNFAPQFVADDGKATVAAVADHVDHIANVVGKEQ